MTRGGGERCNRNVKNKTGLRQSYDKFKAKETRGETTGLYRPRSLPQEASHVNERENQNKGSNMRNESTCEVNPETMCETNLYARLIHM